MKKITQPKEKIIKKLKDLPKEELINLALGLLIDENNNKTPHNKIEVADFIVESTEENLQTCKKIMDDLINKHGDFFANRKSKAMFERMGMFN